MLGLKLNHVSKNGPWPLRNGWHSCFHKGEIHHLFMLIGTACVKAPYIIKAPALVLTTVIHRRFSFNFIWLNFSSKSVPFIINCQTPITTTEVRDAIKAHQSGNGFQKCDCQSQSQICLASIKKSNRDYHLLKINLKKPSEICDSCYI